MADNPNTSNASLGTRHADAPGQMAGPNDANTTHSGADGTRAGATLPTVGFARKLATRNWGWFALRGVLLILFGIVELALPGPTLFAAALVFAAFSFADGVVSIMTGIRGARSSRDRWWALVLSGLLGVAVGVFFLFFPFVSAIALTVTAIIVIAGYAIASGAVQIWAAWKLRREIEGEWLLMAAGVLSVLLGLALFVLLLTAPAPTMLVLAWMIGIWALASGITLLILAFKLRRLRDDDAAAHRTVGD